MLGDALGNGGVAAGQDFEPADDDFLQVLVAVPARVVGEGEAGFDGEDQGPVAQMCAVIAGVDGEVGAEAAADDEFMDVGRCGGARGLAAWGDGFQRVVGGGLHVAFMFDQYADAAQLVGGGLPGLRVEEFVGVEEDHPVGALGLAGQLVEPGVDGDLVEIDGAALEDAEVEAFGLQLAQYIECGVGAAVIEEQHLVDHGGVMAHEGFDDVFLVEDTGDGDGFHSGILPAPPGWS
jgi:hypothetical protein